MRVDIFLSTLLFGITLLTCALAIMQLACAGILRSGVYTPAQRRRVRGWLLSGTIAFALLVFLIRIAVNISGHNLLAVGMEQVERGIFPRMIARLDPRQAPSDPVRKEFQAEGTWTLYSKSSRELRVQRLQLSHISLFSPGVYYWAPAKPGHLCQSWIERIRAHGIEPRPFRGARGIAKSSMIVACPISETVVLGAGERAAWDAIREHVFAGGSLLAIGRHAGDASEAIRDMARIVSFREPSPEEAEKPMRVIFGGPRIAWGGFPSGLQTHIGYPAEQGRQVTLAEVPAGSGEALALSEEYDVRARYGLPTPRLSALVMSDFGSGRVAWTTLPAETHGRSKLLFGQAWEIMGQRVLAYLFQAPQAGLEAWPGGSVSPVVLAVHSATSPQRDLALRKDLDRRKIPSSHYFILSEARERPKHFAELMRSQLEIGTAELDHSAVGHLDFYERYDRLKRWVELFEDMPRAELPQAIANAVEPSRLLRGRRVTGALSTVGANAYADQYAALMANRFTYALMDPFGDQLSPYRAHLAKTADLLKHLGEHGNLEDAASARSLIIWPHRSMDDTALIRAAGGATEREEIKKLIQAQYRHSRWIGAPYLLRVSTGGLGREELAPVLIDAIEGLRRAGASFVDAAELIRFWETRSEVDVVLEPVDRRRLPRDLKCGNDSEADEESIPDEAEDWDAEHAWERPVADGALNPGEIVFRLSVRNGGSETLRNAVLRVSEGGRYQILGRKGKIENGRASSEAPSVRLGRVILPEIEPGQSFSAWVVNCSGR